MSGCGRCPAIPSALNSIPKKNVKNTIKYLGRQRNPITLIAPSNWIAGEFSNSSVSKLFKVEVISNLHGDTDYAEPRSPTSKRIRIGYASKYANSWIKGSDFLLELQSLNVELKTNLEFVFMSDFLDSESTKSRFWQEIDFLFVPSRMDNSPNVIHEARINGVPIIASKLGGIKELLSEDVDISFDIHSIQPKELINRILGYSWGDQQNKNYKVLQSRHKLEQISSFNKIVGLYGINI